MRPDLSIVFGTYNRIGVLRHCLASVRAAARTLDYEIVIVDGGSIDGTLDFLREQPDVNLIKHGELRGAVAAYNDGFKAAQGDMVAYINDDLVLRAETFAEACKLLKHEPRTGIVSLLYTNEDRRSRPQTPVCQVGDARYPFAAFGVLWRILGDAAGWYNGFYHYYGDCYLSVRIQQLGYRLVTLPQYVAKHYNMNNAVRGVKIWDVPRARERAREDGRKWQEMWRKDENTI